MAVKINKKNAIHYHPITLLDSLGIARKIVVEKKEDSRAHTREKCEAKEGYARSFGSSPIITSQGCRLSIKT